MLGAKPKESAAKGLEDSGELPLSEPPSGGIVQQRQGLLLYNSPAAFPASEVRLTVQKSLENCRMILDDLIATGWVRDGATGAHDPNDPEYSVWYEPYTLDLLISPKASEMLKERIVQLWK